MLAESSERVGAFVILLMWLRSIVDLVFLISLEFYYYSKFGFILT